MGAFLWGDSVTRYRLRVQGRRVLGVVEISVTREISAKAIAQEWARELGNQWSVEVVDSDGVTVWRVVGNTLPV